jgi:hypothetical protein
MKDVSTSTTFGQFGNVYKEKGEHKMALGYYKNALAIHESKLGK